MVCSKIILIAVISVGFLFSGYGFKIMKSTRSGFVNSSTSIKVIPKKWDLTRFIKTASFFNALQPKFMRRFFNPIKPSIFSENLLWSKQNDGGLRWGPLDDVVMGGVSKSNIKPGDVFNGNWNGFVTSENNGGFTGIRILNMNPPKDISAFRGFVIKVKGDGNTYKFIARDDDDWNGVAWAYQFETIKDRITEIKIPIKDLVVTKYARSVIIPSGFNTKNLFAFQFSLSKFAFDGKLNKRFTEGIFELNIESVGLYK